MFSSVQLGEATRLENLPISVVIAAKNAERTIKECLDSVQRNNPAEIIIVYGVSTDRTVEIAQRYTNRIYFDKWGDRIYGNEWFFAYITLVLAVAC